MAPDPTEGTRTIVRYLQTASQQKWSGTLRVRSDGVPIGAIIILVGQVAWAMSQRQTETLGSFLWRLGYLTHTQLELARSLFKVHQGRKKLGAIIGECGFVPAAVLRRGLALHVRAAIASMAAATEVSVLMLEATPDSDEPLLFSIEEVMPGEVQEDVVDFVDDRAWQFWHVKSPENDILSPLHTVPGYLAAGIYTGDGAILTAHISDRAFDPTFVGTMLASVRETLMRVDAFAVLGRWRGVSIDCERGALHLRIAGEHHELMLAALVAEDGDHHEMVAQLNRVFPDVEAWANDHSSPWRFRTLLKRLLAEAANQDEASQVVVIAVRERLRQARELDADDPILALYDRALALLEQGNFAEALRVLDGVESESLTAPHVPGKP